MSLKTEITKDIHKCARAIKAGEIVAFGTETVYGLGADCFNEAAVKKIFEAKGRPSDNPLIVHICSIEQAKSVASCWNEDMDMLAKAFWPGPFTIIVPKAQNVPKIVSAGLDTVGIRMPGNYGAVEFIRTCGAPVAAPSANTSGRPSPTKAEHVFKDMKGKIPYILDNGQSEKGLESTVYDVMGKRILRPGVITKEDIEDIVGNIDVSSRKEDSAPKSPGTKYAHYCPSYEVVLIKGKDIEKKIYEICNFAIKANKKCVILDIKDGFKNMPAEIISFDGNLEQCAANLYKILLEGESNIDLLIVGAIPEEGIGAAIMNRLEKAAAGNIIYS